MLGFIIRILGNALALYVAFLVVPGFIITGGWESYLIAGIILGLLNIIVRPIVKLISFPLIILTLGLFIIVINALMLWLVDYWFTFVTIETLTALVLATLVVSVVNMLVSFVSKAA